MPPRLPDRKAALAQYRRRARLYDLELALFEPIRRRAIAELDVNRGDTVLDVGCGTGLSLARLRERVGTRGRVIGIEQSPDMLELARQRVAAARWRNVELIESPVEDAELSGPVVATGLKWARPLFAPTNLVVLPAALRSVTSLEGLARPWSHLQRHLADLEVRQRLLGGVFIASGRRDAHLELNS
jgi:SAM-dependent methyltransferase